MIITPQPCLGYTTNPIWIPSRHELCRLTELIAMRCGRVPLARHTINC
jgi:glycogen synthase